MHNNVYLVTCTATGEQLLIDAADDPHRCLLLVREGTGRLDHLVTTHQHWDHVRALEEVARSHRRHDVRRRRRRRRAAARARRAAGARRRRDGRRARARRHPPARPHPGVGGAVVGRPGRGEPTCSPATRSSPAGSATPRTPGRASTRSTRTSSSGSSRPTTTTPGSTPATATTRRSGPSARTSRSGASAAGDGGAIVRSRRVAGIGVGLGPAVPRARDVARSAPLAPGRCAHMPHAARPRVAACSVEGCVTSMSTGKGSRSACSPAAHMCTS